MVSCNDALGGLGLTVAPHCGGAASGWCCGEGVGGRVGLLGIKRNDQSLICFLRSKTQSKPLRSTASKAETWRQKQRGQEGRGP